MRYRRKNRRFKTNIYHEEIAVEMIRTPYRRYEDTADVPQKSKMAKGIGFSALFLSVLSFFFEPFVLGIIAIVLGFVAQRKGEIAIGAWAIGISAISIILAIFIFPFF